MATSIFVRVQPGVSDEDVHRVEDVFRAHGFDARAEGGYVLTAGTVPWVIWATAPIQAFLSAFAAEAGKDAWKAIERFLGELREVRGPDDGTFHVGTREVFPLGEEGMGEVLVLQSSLPDEALKALVELDLNSFGPRAFLVWEADEGCWIDVLESVSEQSDERMAFRRARQALAASHCA